MKRIVLFVEGEGESEAAPVLLSRIVTDQNGWDAVIVDPEPFRIGHVSKLTKNDYFEWKRKLRASVKRRDVVGVLLLLDGDAKSVGGKPFCAMSVESDLATASEQVGGGRQFSVACVFACMEFESWFIAAARGFNLLPDGRKINLPDELPNDPEKAPRDAKGWLRSVVPSGYKPTRDQAVLARALDLVLLRSLNIRSFRRMENAVAQLISAARTGEHFASPATHGS